MHDCASHCANALAGKASGLDSLEHVYRRGHIFWWRRIHRLFDNGALDVRLSLRTTNRNAARNMGAALTSVTPRVLEMLEQEARRKTDITERELQAIAKAMYEERLGEICTLQRSTPYNAESHSVANLAFIDYFRICGLAIAYGTADKGQMWKPAPINLDVRHPVVVSRNLPFRIVFRPDHRREGFQGPANGRFRRSRTFAVAVPNGKNVPIFAIPAARQVGREPMNECRKLGTRKSAGNGDLWVVLRGASIQPQGISRGLRSNATFH
ncbi:hypothetical protein [Sphingomonas sp. M1A8_2b]